MLKSLYHILLRKVDTVVLLFWQQQQRCADQIGWYACFHLFVLDFVRLDCLAYIAAATAT